MSAERQGLATGQGARGLLSFAGVRLLLGPGDLRMIESAGDLRRSEPPPKGIGWISVFERWWPVYALSFDLAPLVDEGAASRPICAVLGDGENLFGVLCEEVRVARGAGPALSPLPPSMQSVDSPIRELTADADGLICGTDAARLARFIAATLGLTCVDRAEGEGT